MSSWTLLIATGIAVWTALSVLFFCLCRTASQADEAAERYIAHHP